MMTSKAKQFCDDEILAQIHRALDPNSPKALGRKGRNFDDNVWKANVSRFVTEGDIYKFAQNIGA